MNTMQLAWLNATTAQAWHGKGYNLRTALLTKVAGSGLTSFIIGLGYGALLATI